MLKVKAHAKSIDGKSIQIVLYNPATGVVQSTHTINEAPTKTAPEGQKSGIHHVEEFMDKYHRSNPDDGMVSYTIENFAEMSAMPGSDVDEWEQGSGLVEPLVEVESGKEIKTATGNEPKIKTSDDGRPSLEGMTLTVGNKPSSEDPHSVVRNASAAADAAAAAAAAADYFGVEGPFPAPDLDPPSPEIKVKSSPGPISQLPPFMTGDQTAGSLNPNELAIELLEYGNLLNETSLVAGTDFRLPADIFDQNDQSAPPADNPEDSEGPTTAENQTSEDPDAVAPPSPKRKRAVQTDGVPKEVEVKLSTMTKKEAIRNRGIGGDPIAEPVPAFVQTKTERVISHKYNTWIVMGRDRADPEKASMASGYGGRGNTQCGAIDIVVGRMSPNPKSVAADGKRVSVDPIFNLTKKGKDVLCDAARIYISQKTDVDKNFKLKAGRVGNSEDPRSAIAMKADGIRIMAREGIKLVTHADKMNSQGGTITRVRGVDIIAGNQTTGPKFDLQPMVKGNNLRECIEEMSKVLGEVCGTLANVCVNVAELDVALSTHFHPSPFFGVPTLPSPTAMPTCIKSLVSLASVDMFSTSAQKFNLARIKSLYTGDGAKKSIRSKHNNVN
jgi:hypothetical protein